MILDAVKGHNKVNFQTSLNLGLFMKNRRIIPDSHGILCSRGIIGNVGVYSNSSGIQVDLSVAKADKEDLLPPSMNDK